MHVNDNEFLFVEKYRPQTISECILPDRFKSYFQDMVNNGNLQNLLLVGGPGTGKTTVAKALCNELNLDFMVINASENGNIDTIRTTIRSYASTISFTSEYKVVILDEADGLTAAAQQSLRGFIEEFSVNCRFIMTANFANKIIDPLKSRMSVLEFNFQKDELKDMIIALDKRLKQILQLEKISFEGKVLAQMVMRYFPDFRRILNEVQRYSSSGHLEAKGALSLGSDSINELYGYLKDTSKWNEMRKWVVDNKDYATNLILRAIYDKAADHVKPSNLPQLVLILAEADYKSSFVVDREIHMVATLTQIMSDVEFL